MSVFTNRAVIGPDGRFVDANSQIPDAWQQDYKPWVDKALEQGVFVFQEAPAEEPVAPGPGVQAADSSVEVKAGRQVEAKR